MSTSACVCGTGNCGPPGPVQMPADCLGDLLEVLTSEGWELDPDWGPTEPRVTLRRSLPTAIHQSEMPGSASPGHAGPAQRQQASDTDAQRWPKRLSG